LFFGIKIWAFEWESGMIIYEMKNLNKKNDGTYQHSLFSLPRAYAVPSGKIFSKYSN
jgi:hypothetical protein